MAMTRVEAIELAMNTVTDVEALEVLGKIKASLEKKSSKKSGPSDEQISLREEIIRVLTEAGKPLSVGEIIKSSEVLADMSTSKISGNITPMLVNGKNPNADGVIVRSMDKKVAKFAIA